MRYVKLPVVIEAIQFTGFNWDEIVAFCPTARAAGNYGVDISLMQVSIPTLEGDHLANVGDYIIKGVKGEFYPCKPDIFAMTYRVADAVALAKA